VAKTQKEKTTKKKIADDKQVSADVKKAV